MSDTLLTGQIGKLMNSNSIALQSTITCPRCGHANKETMPTDACMFFYVCEGCGSRLRPDPGDCCVFCSYGTVRCPPIQAGTQCAQGGCDSQNG